MSETAKSPALPLFSRSRLLAWGLVLYAALNWRGFVPVLFNGELPGPDDFLRIHQVTTWMAGQAWFDTAVHRLAGSDLHWSRLVEVPIAVLAAPVALFTDPVSALRVAGMAWPLILFLAAVYVLSRMTDRLAGEGARFLVVVFAGLNTFSMVEFVPGRVDHHNAQIVLFLVTLAGLFSASAWRAALAIGISIPLSVAIGLEMLLLLLPVLAGIGLAWAFGGARERVVTMRTGLVMLVASPLFFLAVVPPQDWSVSACDAYSLPYLAALVLTGLGFIALAGMGGKGLLEKPAMRVAAGLGVAALVAVVLAGFFPDCLAGPMGMVDAEVTRRWLADVTEAKGLISIAVERPATWISGIAYLGVMLVVSVSVTVKRFRDHPHLLTLLAVVAVCILASFLQMRFLRIGILATVPFCVMFAWAMIGRFAAPGIRDMAMRTGICVFLTAFAWTLIAMPVAAVTGTGSSGRAAPQAAADGRMTGPALRNPGACFGKADFEILNGLPEGRVMSDLNSATPILVHTAHSAISGPYHRNGTEILQVYDFFQSEPERSLEIARRYGIVYVAACRPSGGIPVKDQSHLNALIWRNALPAWLEWKSSPDSRVAVLKLVP